jgi:hypothetical protein
LTTFLHDPARQLDQAAGIDRTAAFGENLARPLIADKDANVFQDLQ